MSRAAAEVNGLARRGRMWMVTTVTGGTKNPQDNKGAQESPDATRTVVEPAPDTGEEAPTLPGIPRELLDAETADVTQRVQPIAIEADETDHEGRYDPEGDTMPPTSIERLIERDGNSDGDEPGEDEPA